MNNQPIRILEIIADQVGVPRNDGTQGSGLYAVPFRLSEPVSSLWAKVLVSNWDNPPSYTSMHRPGIARVSGDVLTLTRTTIDEIQQYHKQTLLLVVDKTNKDVEAIEEEQRRKAAVSAELEAKQRAEIQDAASKIKF